MRMVLLALLVTITGWIWPETASSVFAGPSSPVQSTLEEELSVRRVVWPVFVSAKKSRDTELCLTLAPDRVRVTEDGTKVVITSLDQERRPTLHALLIDTSESMSSKNKLHLAREAAKRYVDQLRPHESIAVFSFDNLFLLRAPVTRMDDTEAREEMKRSIDAIDVSSGLTYLRDALNQLILHVESFPERKVIIVLTDGVDTMSRLMPDRVLGTAMSTPRQDVTIYSVGVGISGFPVDFVRQLAELTGGRYFGIREPEQIGKTFQEVRDRLARESYLSWAPDPFGQGRKDPPDAEYRFREVRIKSLDKRCRIDNPREYRFSSQLPTKAPDFVTSDAGSSLPATRPLPIGRHWQLGGPEPFELIVDVDSMHGTFIDMVREWGLTPDSRFPMLPWLMSNDEIFEIRPFQVIVPPMRELVEGRLTRPEDILLYWFRNDVRPIQTEEGPRNEILVHGSTFLELREALAESLYAYYPPYRVWARERLAGSLERYLRYRFPDTDDETIRRLLLARLSQPSTREIGLHLATWLGDVSARELAKRLELRAINRSLSPAGPDAAASNDLVETVRGHWAEIREWFPDEGPLRIVTPLIPVYDVKRQEIGFYRVVLPRRAGRGMTGPVPRQPSGLRVVTVMLSDDEIREELHAEGWHVASLEYGRSFFVELAGEAQDPATVAPRLRQWTSLDFERGEADQAERGTLMVIHDEDPENGSPECVQQLTGLRGVDRAIARLEWPMCDLERSSALPSGPVSKTISSK